MIRWLNIGAILLAFAVGLGVLQVKGMVKARTDRVEALAAEIRESREAIRVLRAEWALMSSPALLEERSKRFLALMELSPDQIITDPEAIPMRRRGEEAANDGGVLLIKAGPAATGAAPSPDQAPIAQRSSRSEPGT